MKFSVFAGIAAIVGIKIDKFLKTSLDAVLFQVFAAVAMALALYAFFKLQSEHECHYTCPEKQQTICAYQTQSQMKNGINGVNFSSLCHRDMYNCHNPSTSKKKINIFWADELIEVVAGYNYFKKEACSGNGEEAW